MSRSSFLILIFLAFIKISHAESLPIIPLPAETKRGKGNYQITSNTAILYDKRLESEAKYLSATLEKRLGSKPKLYQEGDRSKVKDLIVLDILEGKPGESYRLHVDDKIIITGSTPAGVFYGIQTLAQLLPLKGEVKVPKVAINDGPRFGWRGMHLDVGRHLFAVEDIIKFIDWMAVHKLNKLHWHLTEDQGWRLEIKKYPKLTQVGAWRESTPPYLSRWGSDGKRYGGFYSQDDVRKIVAHAAERHITVIPEIDMPGHMAAAITAYPKLGNDDIPDYAPKVYGLWGVHPYILAPKEETFAWIDDVLEEVCDLFPSTYIHIGGDEAPKGQWEKSKFAQSVIKREGLKNEHELQSYFIKRVEAMLAKRDRKLIGWDEIREGGLSPNATMMLWRGWEHAIASVNEGHDVVMAPGSHTYFDHYQNLPAIELAKGDEYECIGGLRTLESVYSFNPVPEAFRGTDKAKHILGCQAQLWTEYMKTWDKVEYQAFPRLAALSEVAWSPQANRSYPDFLERLKPMLRRYQAAGIKHFDPFNPGRIKTRSGAKATSSLRPHGANLPDFALDGDSKTVFWSSRNPSKGDHFTVKLEVPTRGLIRVKTGGTGKQADDRLHSGRLEVSKDGKRWQEIAKFGEDGIASGVAPMRTSYLRILVTDSHDKWLIIPEIEFASDGGPEPVAAKIESALPPHEANVLENVLDGNLNSFFWVGRHIKKDESLSLHFRQPISKGKTIAVHTGLPNGQDQFEGAVLESSSNGKDWKKFGEVRCGILIGFVDDQVQHLRIRASRDVRHWIAIRELQVLDSSPVKVIKGHATLNGQKIPLSVAIRLDQKNEWFPIKMIASTYFDCWRPLVDILAANPDNTIRNIDITLDESIKHPAHAYGNQIVISAKHAKNHSGDLKGLFVHELTHIIQRYPPGAPGWFVEGTADYTRFLLSQDDSWFANNLKNPTGRNPLGSYWNSASFLLYLEERFNKPIVHPVSKAIRSKNYNEGIWKELTGENLGQLADEFSKAGWKAKKISWTPNKK